MNVINNTKSLQDIVARNARTPASVYVSFECPAAP
jgi:hypothetical protein